MIKPCSIQSRCSSHSFLELGNLYSFLMIATPGGSFSLRRKINLLCLMYGSLFNSSWSRVYRAGSPGDPCKPRIPGLGENTATLPCGIQSTRLTAHRSVEQSETPSRQFNRDMLYVPLAST